jgi:hypothetical protein
MTSRRLLTTEARVLLGAADLIETHGHCKGHYHKDGAFCAVGAMSEITGSNTKLLDQALKRLSDATDVLSVTVWNDHPDRTAGEVISALRQAALSAA